MAGLTRRCRENFKGKLTLSKESEAKEDNFGSYFHKSAAPFASVGIFPSVLDAREFPPLSLNLRIKGRLLASYLQQGSPFFLSILISYVQLAPCFRFYPRVRFESSEITIATRESSYISKINSVLKGFLCKGTKFSLE